MRWSDIPFSPEPRVLRQFAGLWLGFFGILAAVEWLARGRPALGACLAVLALAVGLAGLASPRVVRPIFVGWMVLAFPVGWTVSLVLLGLLYYGLFTPIALFFRLTGRDALALRPSPALETFWEPHAEPADVRRYFRQF